jgi:hypothetical protein
MGRKRATLKAASIAVLERALQQRKREVEQLLTQRADLTKRLGKIDEELKVLRGAGEVAPAVAAPAVKRGPAKRRGQMSLDAAIGLALKNAAKAMRAADVTDAVLATGYKSQAKNFRQIVASALAHHPNAKRVETGLYEFKGELDVAPKKRGPKPKAAQVA